ncbi:hypothetical protein NliqN6_4021 [Naganishia liquefaciens]|uniref:Zn(2)-C6 fungal-type domain-containing protein n=1 Tax=Naganishia liquefaciens TaxID=104408 RepID=A0A8H3TWR5_9TREE|nr:hypothetical protein NliqN6_4021 [Naganishia liquefaciens]
MPYRRFLREQNIYVPDKILPSRQSSPQAQSQAQLYQSPSPQIQAFHQSPTQPPVYQSSPQAQLQSPHQLYLSPSQPIYHSPPTQVQLYQSPPQVPYFTSPQQLSPQQVQIAQQGVDVPGSRPQAASGMFNSHNLSQPLPPGVIGRAPRNGTIVQQHTHYPFAPQQPTNAQNVTLQPVANGGVQAHTVSSTLQQSTPIKKRKLTSDNALPGSSTVTPSAGPTQPARPSFSHQPSTSSLPSDDAGGGANEQDRDDDADKKGGQKRGKKACTMTGKGPKEKHKAKACIYCRRSHMVCDHERPCGRCIKRGIQNLCIEDGKQQAGMSNSKSQAEDREADNLKRSQSPADGSLIKRQKSTSSGSHTADQSASKPGSTSQQGSIDYWPQQVPRSGSQSEQAKDATSHLAHGISPSQLNSRVNMYNLSGIEGTGDTTQIGALHSTGMSLPPAWPMLPGDATTAEKIDMHTAHLTGNPTLASGPNTEMGWATGDVSDGRLNGNGDNGLDGGNDATTGSFATGIPLVNEPLHGSSSAELPPQATVTNYGTTATERLSRQVQGGEFGVLSDFLESLGIPSLPGGLGDIFGDNGLDLAGIGADSGMGALLGDGFGAITAGEGDVLATEGQVSESEAKKTESGNVKVEEDGPILPKASKAEKYFLAAADQASGTRDERLAKVIKAKYEAGLLKPYDYSRGYAKMYKWLEKNVPSPTTRQAILRPLSVFRPAFRAISQTLSDIDLVFVEEAFERLMLDYDRVFSAIHTPACLWRRTGEIYKANKEFSVLTGIPSALLRGGKIGIYELMTEESMVRYYQLFGSIAFDSGRKSLDTICTLRIPDRLTRVNASSTTPLLGPAGYSTSNTPMSSPRASNFALPAGLAMTRTESHQGSTTPNQGRPTPVPGGEDSFRLVKCCFSFTIRRDSYGFPTAIVGNFIPS